MALQTPGAIALLGSGELADAMAGVHRELMARLDEPIRPVFVDTPAGFETNIDRVDQKAMAYFARNFGLDLALARYHTPDDDAETLATAIGAIGRANYIFAGPGSPSYAVRLWRDSSVWQAILDRWRAGAMLVFASAATATIGAHTLPVYEIYKAGHDVRWIPGLDLLGAIGFQAAVVPHWNNRSGDQFDTRFCYMGAPRFAKLEQQLPPGTAVLGIDEYTAIVIDGSRRTGTVLGVDQVTVRRDGLQATYRAGATIELERAAALGEARAVQDELPAPVEDDAEGESEPSDIEQTRAGIQQALERRAFPDAVQGLIALSLIAGLGLEQDLLDRAALAVQAMQALLPGLAEFEPELRATAEQTQERDTLLDVLMEARGTLRANQLWAAADSLRDRIAALGYAVQDTPDGTSWQRT